MHDGGLAAFRGNLDVQDLRRVLPQSLWQNTGEELPHIGDRPSWGYINVWERDGDEFVPRRGDNAQPLSSEPSRWHSGTTPEDWRRILLDALGTEAPEYVGEEVEHLMQEVEKEATAAFSDGVNTGFYINSYTTKVNPSMDGMLDELRSGLERLQQRREEEPERLRSHFAQTLDVLKNLSIFFLPFFFATITGSVCKG